MNWREAPMARLLMPMMAGILLHACPLRYPAWILGTCCLLALLFTLPRQTPFGHRWQSGLLLSGMLLSFGYLIASYQDTRPLPAHFQHAIAEEAPTVLTGRIARITPTAQRLKAKLQLRAVQHASGQMRKAEGALITYFDINHRSRRLKAGDLIALKASVRELSPPLNPKQFDYRSYQARQGIYHQAFAEEWEVIGEEASLVAYAEQLRQQCLSLLRQHLPTADEFSVGAALVLGYKAELTEEVESAYANTGAMHVLAVSGLHVGLVQVILMALLSRLPIRAKWWRYLRAALVVLCIWAFAFITGASPSVLRAATMFTFVTLGQSLDRTTNIYNTLAASAFLLLCLDPLMLYQVGFQLSYLAVLGIVYFQPRIYRLWYIQNPAGDYLWKLAAVSIAAQIGTLPISLYYFHQFPLYFLLSGLIVVPAAGLILSAGLLLFVLGSWSWAATLAGTVLYGLIYLVNAGIFALEQLPGSLLDGIWLGAGGVLLLYGILACWIAAHRLRQFRWALAGLGLCVLLAASYAWRRWELATQQALTVYHVYKATAVDGFSGTGLASIQSQALQPGRLEYAAQNHRWWRGAIQSDAYFLNDDVAGQVFGQAGFWWAAGKRFWVVQQPGQLSRAPAPAVDLVLLSHSPKVSVADIQKQVDARLILADGSNPPWRAARWAAEAEAAGISFHYTGKQGAYTLE